MTKEFAEYFYIQNIGRAVHVQQIITCFMNDNDTLLFIGHNRYPDYEILYKDYGIFNTEDRVVFENDEWVFPFERPMPPRKTIWYEPRGDNEVLATLKNNMLFACMVIQRNASFQEYSYILHAIEEIDYMTLGIYCNVKGDFMTRVLPKIQPLLKDDMKLVE
ncbi:hypothetical protein [Paenibacillus alvei]|uniref:hypothetical protein n=1 Tax=Paenibacillus alvei TaxID=44250 RepID=UPI00227E4ECA|nr:hypothetical protein [Paenibacillus alvei]